MKKTEKYSPEIMERAVRLVFEAKDQELKSKLVYGPQV